VENQGEVNQMRRCTMFTRWEEINSLIFAPDG
jgi:hypothetical protein